MPWGLRWTCTTIALGLWPTEALSVAVSSSDETTCLQLCSSLGSTADKSGRPNWHLLPSVAAIKLHVGLAHSAGEHGHEALGQCLPSGTACWIIPAQCDTCSAKYLVLHDVFQQHPVPSHCGGVGWMEPARTALSICAELPNRLPGGMAAPGPPPASRAQGPALPSPLQLHPLPFSSPDHINFLEARNWGCTLWKASALLGPWPHKTL